MLKFQENRVSDEEEQVALDFCRLLVARDYEGAFQLLSLGLQSKLKVQKLRNEFEGMIPLDWGAVEIILEEPISAVDYPSGKETWPNYPYITLGGDCYSEAVSAVVGVEGGRRVIIDYEFGRP